MFLSVLVQCFLACKCCLASGWWAKPRGDKRIGPEGRVWDGAFDVPPLDLIPVCVCVCVCVCVTVQCGILPFDTGDNRGGACCEIPLLQSHITKGIQKGVTASHSVDR